MLQQAYINEIFSGIQGEGLWVGFKQIFLRFSGCDLRCNWCDTPDSLSIKQSSSYQIEEEPYSRSFYKLPNPVPIDHLAELLIKLDHQSPHHSLSLTGGEPLLQIDSLKELLEVLSQRNFVPQIFLETGGHRYAELRQIIHQVDLISFDLKLPSSTKERPLWDEHAQFIEVAEKTNCYAKVVVTNDTEIDDLKKACNLIKDKNIQLIIQPVSLVSNISVELISSVKLLKFHDEAISLLKPNFVRVIPQTHKILGQL
ncbi:MAG TPA: 7-carboxy-7-deazaguanine synthase QueE [Vampirovibrionales bacterium]